MERLRARLRFAYLPENGILGALIQSFADEETRALFETGRSRQFRSIERVAKRKLDAVDNAVRLED